MIRTMCIRRRDFFLKQSEKGNELVRFSGVCRFQQGSIFTKKVERLERVDGPCTLLKTSTPENHHPNLAGRKQSTRLKAVYPMLAGREGYRRKARRGADREKK